MSDGLRKRRINQQSGEGKDDQENVEEQDAFQDDSNEECEQGTYWLTRIILLRSINFIYFVAFLVALHQNGALLGDKGLLPVSNHVKQYSDHFNNSATLKLKHFPTLLWFVDADHIDWWMSACAYAGLCLSFIPLATGGANFIIMLSLWILYHSIVNVGQTWYGFGWESQLLETGFLVIFLCPVLNLKPLPQNSRPSFVVMLGYRWLLFRIMLGAGLIKIRGDKCWRDLTCMDYHYQTQPVPNPLSYYLHQSPQIIHKMETLGNHIVELVVPFFLFWPRRCRLWAGTCQILFQIILILSGNLSFLNWLTIIPAIACFDDASLFWLFSSRTKKELLRVLQWRRIEKYRRKKKPWGEKSRSFINFLLACLLIYLSLPVVNNLLSQHQRMNRSFDSLRIVNTYGAFGSITKTRTEIILQGTHSADPNAADAVWLDYEFKCKPGRVDRRPCLISPYHYRLDWLMWFAAFQNYQSNPWFINLVAKLLANDANVTSLLETNPFIDGKPPKFIRAEHYKYTYTKIGSKQAAAGKWWKRKRIDSYLQPVNLNMLKNYLVMRGFDVPRLT